MHSAIETNFCQVPVSTIFDMEVEVRPLTPPVFVFYGWVVGTSAQQGRPGANSAVTLDMKSSSSLIAGMESIEGGMLPSVVV
jgi:hypothetical protein